MSLRCSTSEGAREQPAGAPHNSSTRPRTHYYCAQHSTHSTKGTSVRDCALLTGARFLLGRGLSTHRLLQSYDRPQPPTVICIHPLFGPSEPSPLDSPAKPRASLASLLNQTLCKLSPLPFGVRRWFDYVAGAGPARLLPRTACKELQQVLQLPACSGIQSAGSASASASWAQKGRSLR